MLRSLWLYCLDINDAIHTLGHIYTHLVIWFQLNFYFTTFFLKKGLFPLLTLKINYFTMDIVPPYLITCEFLKLNIILWKLEWGWSQSIIKPLFYCHHLLWSKKILTLLCYYANLIPNLISNTGFKDLHSLISF